MKKNVLQTLMLGIAAFLSINTIAMPDGDNNSIYEQSVKLA